MNHTTNYQLNQWVKSDQVKMEDFNADNAKIDGALAQKAEQSSLNALAQTVAGHTSTLSQKGNCQLWTTSYTGNGGTGPAGARSLSFPKQPRIVFIMGGNGSFLALTPGAAKSPSLANDTVLAMNVSWSGNYVSWYGGSTGAIMMNESGVTYQVTALLPA